MKIQFSVNQFKLDQPFVILKTFLLQLINIVILVNINENKYHQRFCLFNDNKCGKYLDYFTLLDLNSVNSCFKHSQSTWQH